MRQLTSKSFWVVLMLVGLMGLASGCDNNYGWLNFNVLVDLGLDGDVGLFNPFGEGSIFIPVTNGGTDNEPPLPIVIGDETGGGTGVTD